MSFAQAATVDRSGLEELISVLDLGDYLEGTILRGLRRRMAALHIVDLAAYRELLRTTPAEIALVRTLLAISHTGFFRDAARWETLEAGFVTALLARKEHVRVWSAGCSTGEEAYTLAMIFCEGTGIADLARRVSIFATDSSATNLAFAREATYGTYRTDAMPTAMRDAYLSHGHVRAELRSAVHFARHDILKDAPYRHVDLVVCRNTLLYMKRPAQARALARFHVALADEGRLFGGPADGIPLQRHLFERVEGQLYRACADAKAVALFAANTRRG